MVSSLCLSTQEQRQRKKRALNSVFVYIRMNGMLYIQYALSILLSLSTTFYHLLLIRINPWCSLPCQHKWWPPSSISLPPVFVNKMDTLTPICFTHYTWVCLRYSDRGESFHTCCMDLKADNNTWLFIRTSSWSLNRFPSLCVAVLPLRISFGRWSRHLIMASRSLRIWSQIQHQ